jgi:hypothetical protein
VHYDTYHCCRWCKYYEKGACTSDALEQPEDLDLSAFSETGTLAGAIREGFGDCDFFGLEAALRSYNLRRERIDELLAIARRDVENQQVNWTESIDESVSKALENFDFKEDVSGVGITHPHGFWCKEFL